MENVPGPRKRNRKQLSYDDVIEQLSKLDFSNNKKVIDDLNQTLNGGILVPTLVHQILYHFEDFESQKLYITHLREALELSWNAPVQHDDLDYITSVTGKQGYSINAVFQFKTSHELDKSQKISISVGDLRVTIEFSNSDSETDLKCFFVSNNGKQFMELIPCAHKVHQLMVQISSPETKVVLLIDDKIHVFEPNYEKEVDELKISVCSLHHTIPVVFQGDFQSLYDVVEMGVTPKNIEYARKFTLESKGRKLCIGQMFHPVIPIRQNQVIMPRKEYPGFENTAEQLRAAGGFGFICHAFFKVLLRSSPDNEELLVHLWKLWELYLNTPHPSAEHLSRLDAIQMISLAFRIPRKLPEVIVEDVIDMCINLNGAIKEVILLRELLSENNYWQHDLPMCYRLLVRFKSADALPHLEKLLPLILQIVAEIIKKDRGSDDVRDIVTITIEIFKKWCRDQHPVRTSQLVTFMMELYDFEKISARMEKFLWLDENALEREMCRQPHLILTEEEPEHTTPRNVSRLLLQLDLPLGNEDDDELFHFLEPGDECLTTKDFKAMTQNRDFMMKSLLQILHQSYVLCPDNQYACFDSITAEKICYLIEVNSDEKVIGALIEMYEAIINHNVYSEKITKIYQLNLMLILARQLKNKPLTTQTINALFSILLREQVDVSAGLDTSHLEAFVPNAISCQSVYPLLTVLEESVDDVEITVFTVVCTSLNKVYTNNNQLTQALTMAGVDEHMTGILLRLAKMGHFRLRNEKLKALLDTWFAFAVSIIRVGVNGRKSVFEGASRLISHILLLYTQENGKLLNDDNEAQRLIRDNIYWTLCVLLLQLFKFLLDIVLADSNKHRSASNSSINMMVYDEEPEEIDAAPVKPTKFWDEIAQKVKESVLGPNYNLLKCPYRKHKDSPLTADEIRHRIRDVLTLCQYFFKITTPDDSDEEDNLYRIFFEELSRWTLEDAWPNCIWIATDMMFVTNVFSNCVAFVLTDIHRYMNPFRKVFNSQKSGRLEILLQRIREDQNSNLFKLAVIFLNSPSRDRSRGPMDYPQPRTPDLIQRLLVESEIASRYWLDQRNEVISKINLKGKLPQPHIDVVELNYKLEELQRTLTAPKNLKRVYEVCELVGKLELNERRMSRLILVKHNYKPRRISTVLGPKGERMVTEMTEIKTEGMFANQGEFKKISIFRDVFDGISLSRFRKRDAYLMQSLHGVLIANGVQTNPIFYIHHLGITTLPCGSHVVEKTYWFEDITFIFRRPMRPWDVLEVSFEILLKTHETIMVFAQQRFAKLLTHYAGKLIAKDAHLVAVTKQWEEGKTSNFDYLMMLNMFAGRTIHDSSAYPIFPRIVAKFENEKIDLQDKRLYRKLDYPVAAQDVLMIEKHREHYNELKDGRFDFPDRLFYSIESGLGLGKVESSNDYKELVPELFTTVEVLKNENGNQFGERQNGEAVSDVEVPKWCYVDGKPVHEHFIYVHRQALESEHVQSMLHNWIDLVFGYKARGKSAHDAVNVYHPAVYPGSSPPPSFDRVMINAYEANQKTLGTAPTQLFTQPHPKREVVQHRIGSIRNIHHLAFGKELTIGEYEVTECGDERQTSQRVWKRVKSLKSRIFDRSDRGESECIQLFRKLKEKKDKDLADVTVKAKENTLILSDGTSEYKKEHTKKVMEVSADDQFVACLIHQGPIELYKMFYKSRGKLSKVDKAMRGESQLLTADYYGTIPIQNGHFLSVDLCASFATIFTVHQVENKSVVSVWNLHSQHIRAQSDVNGIMESCGVLKNLGELILVEKWNGGQVNEVAKKKKYIGKLPFEHTEQILAKISVNAKIQLTKYVSDNKFIHDGVLSMAPEPGLGIQTLAMIRSDHSIALFETMTLTLMRVLEVENRQQFCLRELRYQDDNTLIAVFKESRTLRKKNKDLYKNLGSTPPIRTWRFRPKL
ncbi:unnamed protein product [Caenorhabditis sp. 36 PRJEB53466]|nr:unnamed protein product [Caenorhabditis sp. 36 PRJEB53466]